MLGFNKFFQRKTDLTKVTPSTQSVHNQNGAHPIVKQHLLQPQLASPITMMQALEEDPDGYILISKTDIYTQNGDGALLMKEGTEVDAALMDRLMQHEIDPGLFYIKSVREDALLDSQGQPVDIELDDEHFYQNRRQTRKGARAVRSAHDVVVLEPNQKGMKKIMDSLMSCGYSLGKMHPLRIAQSLPWTVAKYQPQLLIVDLNASNTQNVFEVLASLDEMLDTIPQIIITASINAVDDFDRFISKAEAMGVQVILKPVSPRHLENLLS